MSSMAAQLTGGTKAADEDWPWVFATLFAKSKFEKGATSNSATDVAITLPELLPSYVMRTRGRLFPVFVACP